MNQDPRELTARVEAVDLLVRHDVVRVAYREELTAVLPGMVDTVSVWTLAPEGTGMRLAPYDLGRLTSDPLAAQEVFSILGPDDAPVLAYSGGADGVGLHAPELPVTALPLNRLWGGAGRGASLLFGARDLRMSYVRVR